MALSAFRRGSTFYILHSGQQQGPFSIAQIRQMRLQNTIPEDTVYWRQGLSEWRPIAELEAAPELVQRDKAGVAVPPPPTPSASGSESESSLEKELRGLAALRSEGIISEEEFTAKKRALLGI